MYCNLFNSFPIIGYLDCFKVFAATNHIMMKVRSYIFDCLLNFLRIGSEESGMARSKGTNFLKTFDMVPSSSLHPVTPCGGCDSISLSRVWGRGLASGPAVPRECERVVSLPVLSIISKTLANLVGQTFLM